MAYYRYELTIDKLLESGARTFPNREIVYRDLRRYSFQSFTDSVKRLVSGLRKLGVKKGDRVAVIDWDTDVYMHAYYAIPMLGATLHTVNIRYPPEIILKTLIAAEDKWIIIRDEFLPLLEKAKSLLPSSVKIIAYSESKEPVKGYVNFWDLLNEDPTEFFDISENEQATIFFTSGTTGDPKGVWFTHRDIVLHTVGTALTFSRSPTYITPKDTFLILVPMFHVHAWGLPYVALINGNKYVLPGKYDYGLILKLMEREGVTFSAMVPTILHMILNHPEAVNYLNVFKNWKVVIGGSALPEGLAIKARDMGITVLAGYGLSETCPVLTVGFHNGLLENEREDIKFKEQITAGTPLPFVDLRIMDPLSGELLPKNKIGEIVVRSPWLTREYYKDPERTSDLWRFGWLHTGDLGYIDDYGYVRIVDRTKDAVKSGGEFIPTLILENIISLHPSVSQVAVVGMKDEKWGERPVAFIVPKGNFNENDLRAFLKEMVRQGKIQDWWIPDRFILIDSMPLTSTNKIDKKVLREKLGK
ncbi:MAG TPA: long-chain-fatty-acid--CoA ligase [Geobacterales bacterium]|nr:long-chain-fatty-acid--CoA ligase [Geobacterales bacterium]